MCQWAGIAGGRWALRLKRRIREMVGGECGGVPPLPIPNREVKPTGADGTAMQCGRVGNRLLFRMKSLRFRKIPEAFLCLLIYDYSECLIYFSLI